MKEQEKVPYWLTTGITYFLPNLDVTKKSETTAYKPCTKP